MRKITSLIVFFLLLITSCKTTKDIDSTNLIPQNEVIQPDLLSEPEVFDELDNITDNLNEETEPQNKQEILLSDTDFMEPVNEEEGSFESIEEIINKIDDKDTKKPEDIIPSDVVIPILQEDNVIPEVENTTNQTINTEIESIDNSKENIAKVDSIDNSQQIFQEKPTDKSIIPTTEKDLTKDNQQSDIETKEATTTPSRNVTILNNQYLDITYPGTGWVYLGEIEGSNRIRYFGRKIGSEDTLFTLRSSSPGTVTLHFYKNDILTSKYIDDYITVTIDNKKATDNTHVVAPSYAEYVPPRLISQQSKEEETILSEKNNQNETRKDERNFTSSNTTKKLNTLQNESISEDNNIQTVIQTTESTPISNKLSPTPNTNNNTKDTTHLKSSETSNSLNKDNLSPDEILALAQKSLNEKKYNETLSLLDTFFDISVTRLDEGLFIQGQVYEANSNMRNIKKALDSYQELIDSYPQSINWDKANERLTYLKRFYFNIR